MADRIPTFFILVPGPWKSRDDVADLLGGAGIAATAVGEPLKRGTVGVELIEDEALGDGFAQGRSPSVDDDVVDRISELGRAALLEIAGRLDEDPNQTAAIGRVLRDAGGLAIRMEGSGAASPWDDWLDDIESGGPFELYNRATLLVSDGDGTVFTCGMQQFDSPDAEITTTDPDEAVRWLDALCCFQLGESPVLGTGHIFRPDAGSVPCKLERWPDHRHRPDDGRHNPFGVWRLLRSGDESLEAMDPVPVITPSLVAQLLAAEGEKGAPLTQSEVEKLVDRSPAIAMALADALTLERHGFAIACLARFELAHAPSSTTAAGSCSEAGQKQQAARPAGPSSQTSAATTSHPPAPTSNRLAPPPRRSLRGHVARTRNCGRRQPITPVLQP